MTSWPFLFGAECSNFNTVMRLTNKIAFFWHLNGTLAHDEFSISASPGGKQMCPFILNIPVYALRLFVYILRLRSAPLYEWVEIWYVGSL